MRVQQVMVRSPKSCHPELNCAAAVELLWVAGCGALPVVDAREAVVGIVTDRDICIALGTRNRRASELTVGEVMTAPAAVCHPDDDIHEALKIMRARKVRRLPVTGPEGRLEGMLSASEVLLHARNDDGSRPDLSFENVVSALRGICWHHPLATHKPAHA